MTIGTSVLPSRFRARMAGAVVRFPGTGEGVARLVPVSMVKVDIAAACNLAPAQQPVPRRCPLVDNREH